MTVVRTYHNFHVHTYKAQLVGAANIIEQYLTNTPCSAAIDTTLNMGSCIPQENPKHIIVCRDLQHNRQEMNTLGVHKIKQQGTYILIPSLHVGGAIQEELVPTRGIVQLDNGLVIRHQSLRISLIYPSKANHGSRMGAFVLPIKRDYTTTEADG